MLNRTLKGLCFLTLLITFVAGLYSTFTYKQLIRDGSQWAFRLFHFKSWVLDEPFSRYSSTVVQTPAVIAAKLGAVPDVVNWLYGFGYFIYPFIAFVIIYLYLRNKKRTDLVYPIFLSFFMTILPTWAFANSIATEAIVIFWFLYAYIIAEEKPHLLCLFVLGCLLLLSYESGFIFYGLVVWLLWREKKLRGSHLLLFGCLSFIQIYNYFFIIRPGGGDKFFTPSVAPSFASPFLVLIPILMLSLFLISKSKALKLIGIAISVIASGYVIYNVSTSLPRVLWIQSYLNRVWSIPASFLILFSAFEFIRFNRQNKTNLYLGIVLLFSLPGFIHELIMVYDSKKLIEILKPIVRENKGCIILSREKQKEIRQRTFLPDWDLPYLSMVLQSKKKVETIIISDYESDKPKIFCQLSNDNKNLEYTGKWTTHQIYLKGNYDFSLLIPRK